MNIKDVISERKISDKLIVKDIIQSDRIKMKAIAMESGDRLIEHKTKVPTLLIVVSGKFDYEENDNIKLLSIFDQHNIPIDILHALNCKEDGVCLLLQGY